MLEVFLQDFCTYVSRNMLDLCSGLEMQAFLGVSLHPRHSEFQQSKGSRMSSLLPDPIGLSRQLFIMNMGLGC